MRATKRIGVLRVALAALAIGQLAGATQPDRSQEILRKYALFGFNPDGSYWENREELDRLKSADPKAFETMNKQREALQRGERKPSAEARGLQKRSRSAATKAPPRLAEETLDSSDVAGEIDFRKKAAK